METFFPKMSVEDLAEDELVRDVLGVTLQSTERDAHYLPALAADVRSTGNERGLMHRELADRLLVARLIDEPPPNAVYSPFQYLLKCYANVYSQTRALSNKYRRQQALLQRLNATLVEIKELVLSYAGLVFTPGVIPNTERETGMQILASIETIDFPKIGVQEMPPLFMEEFAANQDEDMLQELLKPICHELQKRMQKTTLAGEFNRPLQILQMLVNAKWMTVITQLPSFLNPHDDGFKFASGTILGSVLSIGPFPDHGNAVRPDIGQEFFPDLETAGDRDLHQSILSLRRTSRKYGDDLHGLFRTLLKKETRSRILEWFSHAIESNKARGQMRPNPLHISSNGFCFNLCTVLLKLCEPFVDPQSGKAWPHLTTDYVLVNNRLDFMEDTKLAMSSDELEELQKTAEERRRGQPPYHFICECFFMTLKALHLGTVKIITSLSNLARQIQRWTDDMEEMEAALNVERNPVRKTRIEVELKRCKAVLKRLKSERLCMEAIVFDEVMLADLNTFYRLVIVWFTRLTSVNSSAEFQIPMPDPVPPQFAALPEYFLEDLVDVLIHTGRVAPQVLQSVELQETVVFFMAMMGSPNYVKNPYLRTKLSEVLYACLPQSVRQNPAMRRRSDILAFVFDNHPVILSHLVPCLLQLYVDIEFTGRHTQFYEKFYMRAYIQEVLEYVWNIQEHNDSWKAIAAKDGGRGLYLQFTNMLVNDSIFLLDESLKKLEEIKEIETLMGQTEEWNRLTAEEQQERERDLRQHGAHLKACFHQAQGCIQHLCCVTRETQKTFLLPEMVDRVASMLNYFLKYITGPERKKLKVKNLKDYQFDPKELLVAILEVYLHLESADVEGAFASAISSDGRSYRDSMFAEALAVIEPRTLMPPDQIQEIKTLAQKCKEAALQGAAEEEILGDIPEEFLDPIQFTLMRDPVILPTSGNTLDRATITRHLLSDPKDPFNREELTIDMLKPNDELKERINQWLKEQKSAMQID